MAYALLFILCPVDVALRDCLAPPGRVVSSVDLASKAACVASAGDVATALEGAAFPEGFRLVLACVPSGAPV